MLEFQHVGLLTYKAFYIFQDVTLSSELDFDDHMESIWYTVNKLDIIAFQVPVVTQSTTRIKYTSVIAIHN